MGYLADIYIIKKTRSKKEAVDFLNHFLPNREESADDYWIPEGATKPIHEFYNASDLMSFLELNSNYSNRIYWRNLDQKSPNKHGMVFYNKDGSMVFGISRNADMSGNYDTQNETECLNEMKIYFDTNLGYIHYENPPADNYKEFVEIVNQLEI
ncbi:hypothetical protein [Tenacibaculum sp. 190524A05c]|uniref:Uncharacterized protein n=1 Tax=Tenacibaculum platacis TaxID=3137852 RepID=A0ABP1ECW1_9FLAO